MISIIIPLYNSEEYIIPTLNSIVKQTSNQWECIIVNDGSTDNSVLLVLEFISQVSNSQFLLINQENKGPGIARNLGVSHSKFDLILFLDADDLLSRNCIKNIIDTSNNSFHQVYCFDHIVFGKNVKRTFWNRRNYVISDLNWFNWLPATGVVMHKSLFLKVQGYSIDPIFKNGIEDLDFWIRISKYLTSVKFIDDCFCFYRVHSKSRGKSIFKKRLQLYKIIYARNKQIIGKSKIRYWERAFVESSFYALHENDIINFHKICLEGFLRTLDFKFLKRLNLFYCIRF